MDGSQRQLYYLLRGLDRDRFEPVVVLDRDGPLTKALNECGIQAQVHSFRAWRSFPAGLLRYFDAMRLSRIGKKAEVNLVHACDMWKSGYLRFIARRLGIPGVLHIRGPLTPRDAGKLKFHELSAIIAIAQRYHNDLRAGGIPSDRIEVIDDAVDLERFKPNPTAREFLQKRFGVGREVLIGLVGRIEPFKRVLEFLEAFAPLAKNTSRPVKAMIFGQPKDLQYYASVLAATKRLGLQSHVIFARRCNEMESVMAGLDVLATMSGGSAMFEAMACATPVLSIRTDDRHSVHTRHNETALCVTADDPKPATEALAQYVNNPDLRARIGQAGRAWVERHLSPSILVNRTQMLYTRLLPDLHVR